MALRKNDIKQRNNMYRTGTVEGKLAYGSYQSTEPLDNGRI